jgi:hypothetical protein
MVQLRPKGLPATLNGPRPLFVPKPKRKRHFMTVGIGAACQQGKCVVMATDTKGSFVGNIFPDHNKLSKQLALPFGLCGSIAGHVDTCNAVENRLYMYLGNYPRGLPVPLQHVLDSIEKARDEEFRRRVNDKMLASLGMSLKEWQDFPSRSPQYRRGHRVMKRYQFPVELIVGGIIMGSGVLLSLIGMDTVFMGELAIVGTGGVAAYAQLMRRGQNAHLSISRTLLHVAESLLEAKSAEPKTVGEPADYVVITENQTRRMPAKDPTLQKMLRDYAGAETDSIDSDTDLFNALQAAMYVGSVSKEDYAKGIRTAQAKR